MKRIYLLKIYLSIIGLCLWSFSSVAQGYDVTTVEQCNNTAGGDEIVDFTSATPTAIGDGTLTVYFRGDFGTPSIEYLDIYGEGAGPILGTGTGTGSDCDVDYDSVVITIPMADINNWASDGVISFTADAPSGVSAGLCFSPAVAYCVYMKLEYPRASGLNDMGVASLDTPTVFCAGPQNIWVTVQNYGINQISSGTVNWTWNGVAQTPVTIAQLIDTAQGTNPNNIQLMLGTKTITNKDTLVVWTSSPNGGVDTVNANDTITRILAPSLSGTFAIGGATPDYTSFSAAVADMSAYGICGPVVLNVASGSGPYNEQVEIPEIVGSSATNTITINGNGETLTFGGSSSNYFTLNLDGADYITINDLNIEASGSSNSWALHLMSNADNNSFNNCSFSASMSSTSSTTGCVSMSGSTTSYSSAGNNGSNNTFTSCSTSGGYMGFALYGSAPASGNAGNSIINSTISDYYYYGMYNVQQSGLTISGDTIHRPTRTSVSSSYTIYLSTGCEGSLVEKNHITNLFGGNASSSSTAYTIYVSGDGTPGNENKIINNLIYDLGGNGSHYGLYLSGADYVQVYHNTIALNTASSTGGATRGIYATGSNVEIKNNDIYITRGGTGAKYCLYFTGGTKDCDNNNLYMGAPAGNNNIGYYSGDYATLTGAGGWQSANGGAWDQNSKTTDPQYVNAATGDYTPSAFQLDNTGAVVGVTTDINGATRSATTPDIGAYEFSVPLCAGQPSGGDASVDGSQNTSACFGQPLTVTLDNYSTDNGISIQWEESIDGGFTWTPISGATMSSVGVTFNFDAMYHAIVTCVNGGFTATSTPVTVITKPFFGCYCSPLTGVTLQTSYSNYLTDVEILNTTLSVSTTTYGTDGYMQHDYTQPGNTATLTQGQTYTLLATSSSTYANSEVWIDWDQSGTFDSVEYVTTLTSAIVDSATFIVPGTAVPGMTGLRVRSVYNNTLGAAGACDYISSARETEDFVITINPGIPCSGPPSTPGTIVPASTFVCNNQTTTMTLTGHPVELGITYQWESSPAGLNTFTPVSNMGTTPNYTTLPLTASTDYRVAVTCSNTGGTAYSGVVTINVPSLYPGGIYTIDSTTPTGGTNFQNFTDAINAITCGIAGPIVFNVTGTTTVYNEQINMPATIGSSATNTVTINGNGVTLQNTDVSNGNYATLNLDGADFITVNDLVIKAADDDTGFAVHLMNSADSNTFHNCSFIANSVGSSGTYSGCVNMSGSTTSYSTAGNNGNGNTFSNCSTSGGYFAFYFYGQSGSNNTGNKVIGCTIEDYYVYGLYNVYQSDAVISGNTFERPSRGTVSTGYGVYLSSGCTNMLVEKNTISNLFGGDPSSSSTVYAIYCGSDGSVGNENKFINNLIYDLGGNGSHYAMYLSGADYIHVYHNTIALNTASSTGGTTRGIYSTGSIGGIEIKNNNIFITRGGSGTKHCLYFTNGDQNSDNNNLYINAPAGSNYVGYYSGNQTTLSDWQLANGGVWDQNSYDVPAIFVNPAVGDYTPAAGQLDNTGAPVGIMTDITGAARSTTTPDIGAYEFTAPPCQQPIGLAAANITSSSADVSWTAVTGSVGYEYAIDQTSTAIPTGTVTTTTSTTPPTITGLSSASDYYLHVRSDCGSTNGFSTWSVYPFSTVAVNDVCSGALPIMMAGVSGNNTYATDDILPSVTCGLSSPDGTYRGLWYTVTPASSGNLTVSLCSGTTIFDAYMRIFEGTCGSFTACAGFDDDSCYPGSYGTLPTETFAATANTTYYVFISGWDAAGFGPFTLTATGVPLAIKLVNINAENMGSKNRINWVTGEEKIGDYFELEKSADGKNFAMITSMKANGEASTYTYVDQQPFSGKTFYRLKMYEANGNYEYSKVVTATMNGKAEFSVRAYPNPVSDDKLTIEASGTDGNNATVMITDITGKVIKAVTMTNGMATIDMNGMAQGIYLVKYTDSHNSETIKVNKQ